MNNRSNRLGQVHLISSVCYNLTIGKYMLQYIVSKIIIPKNDDITNYLYRSFTKYTFCQGYAKFWLQRFLRGGIHAS